LNDYIFMMYQSPQPPTGDWAAYFTSLRQAGRFEGGSAIGAGIRVTSDGAEEPAPRQLVGYLRVTAESMQGARELLIGNPIYEAGGIVEIRELPRDG
jgi:hypothetical protein